MPEYIGHWLECRNRNCGFPVRVPYFDSAWQPKPKRNGGSVLFACPVCLEVNPYTSNNLRQVEFRHPDPYEGGKLVLYSVLVGCARPCCRGRVTVNTAAAANVSLALLLRLWKSWNIDVSCDGSHRFVPRQPHTWWVEEKNRLNWRDGMTASSE
ncbi:MAG TPA: hypothetical protein VFU27_09850 [Terriglobales bacterium]|nr:hypothetical protein [Terriglobales bacterium]